MDSYKDVNYDATYLDGMGNIQNEWSSANRYKWIEYHKWKFSGAVYTKLVGDLVLMSRAQFGYLATTTANGAIPRSKASRWAVTVCRAT